MSDTTSAGPEPGSIGELVAKLAAMGEAIPPEEWAKLPTDLSLPTDERIEIRDKRIATLERYLTATVNYCQRMCRIVDSFIMGKTEPVKDISVATMMQHEDQDLIIRAREAVRDAFETWIMRDNETRQRIENLEKEQDDARADCQYLIRVIRQNWQKMIHGMPYDPYMLLRAKVDSLEEKYGPEPPEETE